MKLTAIQISEAKKCKSPEEVVEKAKAHGIEMTLEEAKEVLAAPAIIELDDDDLATVSGGGCKGADAKSSVYCYNCGGTAYWQNTSVGGCKQTHYYSCGTCEALTIYEGDVYNNCIPKR